MAEDSNDMEVEDILSSIKNILEEDAQNSDNEAVDNKAPESNEAPENVLDQVLADDSDIIQLSDDMRISEQDNNVATADDGIDNEQQIEEIEDDSPVGAALSDLDRADETVSLSESSMIETSPAEEFANDMTEINQNESSELVTQTLDEQTNEISANTYAIEETAADNSAESISSATEESIPEAVENSVVEVEQPAVAEAENEEVSVTDTVETIKYDDTNNLNTDWNIPTNSADTDASAHEAEMQESLIVENVPVSVAAETVNEPSSTSDAVDASVNIINNFAKIFSKNKNQGDKSDEAVAEPTIDGVGNPKKTLEEFVQDAIAKVIGEDIARQWNDGAAYQTIAEEEIKSQVQTWINNNLATIVEKIVKEEMERVIAKVGS